MVLDIIQSRSGPTRDRPSFMGREAALPAGDEADVEARSPDPRRRPPDRPGTGAFPDETRPGHPHAPEGLLAEPGAISKRALHLQPHEADPKLKPRWNAQNERASLAQPSQSSSPIECTSHLSFSLVVSHVRNESFRKAPWKTRHVDTRRNFKNDPSIPNMTDC